MAPSRRFVFVLRSAPVLLVSATAALFFLPACGGGPAGGLGAFAVVSNAPDCSWWVEARSPDDDWIDNDFSRGRRLRDVVIRDERVGDVVKAETARAW